MSAQSATQPCNNVNLLFYIKSCLCSKLFLCSSVPVLLMSVTTFIRDETDFPWFVAGKQHIRTFVSRRLSQDYQDIGTCYLINRPCSLFPVSPQLFTCFCRWACACAYCFSVVIFNRKRGNFEKLVHSGSVDWTGDSNRQLLRAMMMTACDVAAITKPWELQQKVSCYPENAHSYRQTTARGFINALYILSKCH